jgi:dipeptidase D
MDPVQHVLTIFERLSAIPRGSGNEAQVAAWLQSLAAENGYPALLDEAGNLLIRIPGTPGRENAPVVVLQGHMDMVCEKTPDSPHDFLKDAIRCIVDGDWLHADGTTLGADNGIAIALALGLVSDPSVAHPPLELLFTVQEEVGLHGANRLQPGFVSGKILVNLDSEDVSTFIVGCAGGQTTQLNMPVEFEDASGKTAWHLKVSGLRGGHSGVDIHRHYASANKLIGRALAQVRQSVPVALISLAGGTAHNAISRGAEAVFTCDPQQTAAVEKAVAEAQMIFNQEYTPVENEIVLTLSPAQAGRAATEAATVKVIQLLLAVPHGVAEMSASIPGFVETSNNLAHIALSDGNFSMLTSQRSTVMSRMTDLTARITSIGLLAGAEVASTPAYPGWKPDMKSPLLQRSKEIYQSVFGAEPEVTLIHGGLECGTIGAIYPGMDMLSIGVTIENPHSPGERMYIPSIGRIWSFMVAFLASYR